MPRIVDESVVICDELIKETTTIPTKSTSTKCTLTNFVILLALLLITITLLIAVSTYLMKHHLKQKRLLPFHDTSKLKEIDINNIL